MTRRTAESLAACLARERGLADARVLDIVGQAGFALQSLHDEGRAHGAVTADAIALHDDGGVTLEPGGPAEPAPPAARAADLAALGRVGRAALGRDADPGVRGFLDSLAEPRRGASAEAGDVARTALAMAAGTQTAGTQTAGTLTAPPVVAVPGTAAATDHPGIDREQRRVRNRFIVIGAVVVLVGLVLLKTCGGGGQAVPDVRGDTYPAAVMSLHAHGFGARERTTPKPAGQRVGTVIGQDPPAGARPRAGTTITLTVAR